MSFKKILIPVDGSDASKNALNYAIAMAKQYEAELHLIYVADVSEAAYPVMQVTLDRTGLASIKERAEKVINNMKELVPEDVKLISMVKIGIPGNVISNLVEDDGIDLVVMGNSGKGSISSFITGSVSHYVIHHVKCPVLIVK